MTPVSTSSRQRLEQIRERTQTARSRRQRAREALDAARDGGDRDAEAVAMLAFDEADTDLQVGERLENQLLSSLSGLESSYGGSGIFEDPQTVEALQRMGSSSFPIGSVDLGPLSTRDELVEKINTGAWGQPKMAAVGSVDVPDSARLGGYYGTVTAPRRRLSLLDLIPASPMTGSSFGYMQEVGDPDVGVGEAAEGAVKPQADFGLIEAEVKAATIPTWTKMKRQQLADVPELGTVVSDGLTYRVLRRFENQILAGDGQGENLQGIIGMTGIGDVAFSGTVALTDLALDGIVDVLLGDLIPDAVAVNPKDWGQMLKAREGANTGARLDGPGAFAATTPTLWGLPAVPSTALTEGEALVGAFATCARVFIREAVNVRLSDSDQDDFIRNLVTALAEMRGGLMVQQPSGFCLVHLK